MPPLTGCGGEQQASRQAIKASQDISPDMYRKERWDPALSSFSLAFHPVLISNLFSCFLRVLQWVLLIEFIIWKEWKENGFLTMSSHFSGKALTVSSTATSMSGLCVLVPPYLEALQFICRKEILLFPSSFGRSCFTSCQTAHQSVLGSCQEFQVFCGVLLLTYVYLQIYLRALSSL